MKLKKYIIFFSFFLSCSAKEQKNRDRIMADSINILNQRLEALKLYQEQSQQVNSNFNKPIQISKKKYAFVVIIFKRVYHSSISESLMTEELTEKSEIFEFPDWNEDEEYKFIDKVEKAVRIRYSDSEFLLGFNNKCYAFDSYAAASKKRREIY